MRHIPRKRFGQHFLTDPAIIDAIVRAIDPRLGEALVEIGPGLAALTQPLAERAGRLTVIELDRDLAARLRADARLTVIEADALKVDFGALRQAASHGAEHDAGHGADRAPDQRTDQVALPKPPPELPGQPQPPKLRLCGNLPYNISTPLLFHLMAWAGGIADQHFMLQKEVVDRMTAAPATHDYGRLTVMLQWRYAMTRVLAVPPGAFDPPPKVDSAVVRMTPRPNAAPIDARLLSELVQTAFSQRRKLLRHTLGRWLDARDYVGPFDTHRRAEEVPVDEYLALAGAVQKFR